MKSRNILLLCGLLLASALCQAQNYMIFRSKTQSSEYKWEPVRIEHIDQIRFDQGATVKLQPVQTLTNTSVRLTAEVEMTDTLCGQINFAVYGSKDMGNTLQYDAYYYSDNQTSEPELVRGKCVVTHTFDNLMSGMTYNAVAYVMVPDDGIYQGAYIDSETIQFKTGDVDAKAAEIITQKVLLNWCKDELNNDQHYGYGLPSLMHVLDVMTSDIALEQSGYNWYSSWYGNRAQGDNYVYSQFIWNTLIHGIDRANFTLNWLKPMANDVAVKPYLGMAYAMRAYIYVMMGQMYEFLENDMISPVNHQGNYVRGLTVPIITENASQNDSTRVNKQKLVAFIKSDLTKAEDLLASYSRPNKTMIDQSVIDGLRARLAMWNEDYAEASLYARKAYSNGTPLTSAQWLDTQTGFNTLQPSSWLWGLQYEETDQAVVTGLVNWTSWMSAEYESGYAFYGVQARVDKHLYDQIPDTDFRKLSWKAPAGTALHGQNTYVNPYVSEYIQDLTALKFRPNSSGNPCCVAVPLMRVEEMMLIDAEAQVHLGDVATGVNLLNNFVKGHRDANYNCSKTNAADVIEEILLQKRIELWGEGQVFFDFKRLNHSVDRAYAGTNHDPQARFCTSGRPAWMNIVFVRTASRRFPALEGWNNPDPSDVYNSQY